MVQGETQNTAFGKQEVELSGSNHGLALVPAMVKPCLLPWPWQLPFPKVRRFLSRLFVCHAILAAFSFNFVLKS